MKITLQRAFRYFAQAFAILGLGSIVPILGAPVCNAADSKPNIIYILADDLGYGDLGCYGQQLIKTPNIDRIAAEGMKFTDHYSGAPVCAPARCVLLTGLHTGHCPIRNNKALEQEGNVPIPKSYVTLGEVMKQAGYATGAFGKWGQGFPGSEGDPVKRGFDHFFGYNCQREAHNYYPGHLWRNREKVILEGNQGGQEKQYSHDLITEEALEFIRNSADKPFFAYVPYTIPHTKFQVPDLGQYANTDWDPNHKIQAAMISRMDRDVGRIMDLVKEIGQDDNTLIIFTSDNGPHGGGGTLEKFKAAGTLRAKKGATYEGGIRVPFLARWPGRIKPGTTSNHVSGFQDMMPTFAELAGAKPPAKIDGISMLPTLLGEGIQQEHDYLYWELRNNQGLRVGNWKAVRINRPSELGPIELYNLADDPGETHNVAWKNPDLVRKMKKLLEEAREPSELFPNQLLDRQDDEKRVGKSSDDDRSNQDYRVTTPPADLELLPFYKKYVNTGGYAIVSSGKVNDYALKEAAYLVDMMLAERPDLRRAMIASGSRLIVIAHSEFTSDIPEYSQLRPKNYWDARARGLGGSRDEAVCSCAEENVLAFEGDPYSTENILIHEFAHNIHYRGMINLDPTFDDRLRKTYERAMAQGLWKGKYPSVNHAEYFAEGVQSWFNNNRQPDHDHNHVDTREELREYDPGLASICEEVFGKTELAYTKPTTRLDGHLAGYDPEKSPIFQWPEKLEKMKQQIRDEVKKRGDKRQQEYKN